jgi:hypothetical protein
MTSLPLLSLHDRELCGNVLGNASGTLRELYGNAFVNSGNALGTFVGTRWEHFGNSVETRISYLTNYGQNVELWTFWVTMVTFTCLIL